MLDIERGKKGRLMYTIFFFGFLIVNLPSSSFFFRPGKIRGYLRRRSPSPSSSIIENLLYSFMAGRRYYGLYVGFSHSMPN